jgi:hypothetical protein
MKTDESSKTSTDKSALEVTCGDLQTELNECQRRLQQAEVALQHISSFRVNLVKSLQERELERDNATAELEN